jgi:hypothetical protein
LKLCCQEKAFLFLKARSGFLAEWEEYTHLPQAVLSFLQIFGENLYQGTWTK